jgi:adenylate kinase family enzyme
MNIVSIALMEKIVIIGSAGAGKSTLARNLGSIFNTNVRHLDRFLWEYGWKGKAEFERMEILETFAFGEKQWIIEGNYLRSSKIHLDTADTIIFLDIVPLVCCWHLIKRSCEYYNCPRYDIPPSCTDKITLRRLWKTLTFPFHGRKMIEHTLCNYESKRIIRLHSTKEIQAFLVEQEQSVVDTKDPSTLVPPRREKILMPPSYPRVTPSFSRRA